MLPSSDQRIAVKPEDRAACSTAALPGEPDSVDVPAFKVVVEVTTPDTAYGYRVKDHRP